MANPSKIVPFVLFPLIVLSMVFISRQFLASDKDREILASGAKNDLVGDWKEYIVQGERRSETSLRRFSFDRTGALVQTLQVELGPQCRIWVNQTDVSFEDGVVEIGGEFKGPMSADRNSITLEYEHRLGETHTFLLERVLDPPTRSFLDTLEGSIGAEYEYTVPPQHQDGLLIGTLAAQIDTSRIFDLVEEIRQGKFNDLHSLLIARNDTLVFEEYFGGRGKVLGTAVNSYYRERVHQLASVTKSVTSALAGIAWERKHLSTVSQPIHEFFPEYEQVLDSEERGIETFHLLTMTAGWEWNESSTSYSTPTNDANALWLSENPIGYVFGKKIRTEPGTRFLYNSGGSDVLGEIVRRAVGEPLTKFAEKTLFTPMGISMYTWNVHPSGVASASGGLSLRTRDLMKFGLLFLHEGQWGGQQIISPDWIKESTSPHIPAGTMDQYGYQWWIGTYRVEGRTVRCYYAMGLGGNFLSVFPELDLVVASTAQDFETGWRLRYYSMLGNYILPAVLSRK